MNSVTQKVEKLRSIASSLGLQGESVEAIIQMLGYALHTSEVEHIAYTQEASLERATEINSKIQHCVNMMYSVFRGTNPRVIITFSPQKRYTFNPGDLVTKTSTFNAYYLGYWDEGEGEFIESGIIIYPGGANYNRTIMCVLSQFELEDTWKVDSGNLFYHTVQKAKDRQFAKLSSDYVLYMSDTENGEYVQLKTTRRFSEHERLGYFFDLTLPGFGINLYYPNKYTDLINRRSEYSDKWFKIKVQEEMLLGSLNPGDLENLVISGSIPVETPSDVLKAFNSSDRISFPEQGLIYIYESGYDSLESIHYLANKNRYAGSYLATNSDLSFLLSESFPNKIRQTDGVICRFNEGNNDIVFYYIPTNASLEITDSEKNRFIGEQSAYYVTKNIDIRKAPRYNVKITLNLDLYEINDLNAEIEQLLKKYQYKFGVDLGDPDHPTPDYLEIKSLISKIDEVKLISDMDVNYTDINGNAVTYEDIMKVEEDKTVNLKSRYLTLKLVEKGHLSWSGNKKLYYSIDSGASWKSLQNNESSQEISSGIEVWVKSDLLEKGEVGNLKYSGTFDVSGNIMSLLHMDSYKDKLDLATTNTTFAGLFSDNSKLRNAEDLILPATSLSDRCYFRMFEDCKNLISAPALEARILSEECYAEMFSGCNSLKSAPNLPSKYLASGCYSYMFKDCKSLRDAPGLPAKTLKISCYTGMFSGCTSLEKAPSLPSRVMVYGCYKNMFKGCNILSNAPALPAMNLDAECYFGMFESCKSLRVAPELPATELKKRCYSFMFKDCTSLSKSPVLPASTLLHGSYESMFQNCSSLAHVKALFSSVKDGTTNWLTGVSKAGIFVKSKELTVSGSVSSGVSSIVPKDWEVIQGIYDPAESEFEEVGTVITSDYSNNKVTVASNNNRQTLPESVISSVNSGKTNYSYASENYSSNLDKISTSVSNINGNISVISSGVTISSGNFTPTNTTESTTKSSTSNKEKITPHYYVITCEINSTMS